METIIQPQKQYDFSSLNVFFNDMEKPQELANDLVELAFNYAMLLDDYSVDLFKNDMSTIYLIWQEVNKIKVVK